MQGEVTEHLAQLVHTVVQLVNLCPTELQPPHRPWGWVESPPGLHSAGRGWKARSAGTDAARASGTHARVLFVEKLKRRQGQSLKRKRFAPECPALFGAERDENPAPWWEGFLELPGEGGATISMQSPADRHLRCFRVLAIVNSLAVNIGARRSLHASMWVVFV